MAENRIAYVWLEFGSESPPSGKFNIWVHVGPHLERFFFDPDKAIRDRYYQTRNWFCHMTIDRKPVIGLLYERELSLDCLTLNPDNSLTVRVKEDSRFRSGFMDFNLSERHPHSDLDRSLVEFLGIKDSDS